MDSTNNSNQDYIQNNNPNVYNVPPRAPQKKENVFVILSLIFGIISIVLMCCVYPGFILGGLGIVFALISRGSLSEVKGLALGGLITSIIGICMSVIMLMISFIYVFSNPEYIQQFDDMYDYMYEDIYGETFDDLYKDFDDDYFFPDDL